jgi:hypothetical protein
LGQILKKAQADGFLIKSMTSTRPSKHMIKSMAASLSPTELKEAELNFSKTFCSGPVVILWLYKYQGLFEWLSILGKFL